MSPRRLKLQRTCPQGIRAGKAYSRMPAFLIFVPFKSPFLKKFSYVACKMPVLQRRALAFLWAVQNRLEFWILLPVGIIIAHLPIISNLFKEPSPFPIIICFPPHNLKTNLFIKLTQSAKSFIITKEPCLQKPFGIGKTSLASVNAAPKLLRQWQNFFGIRKFHCPAATKLMRQRQNPFSKSM